MEDVQRDDATGILAILPWERSGSRGALSAAIVGGIPLLRRIVLAAERGGWTPAFIGSPGSAVDNVSSAVLTGRSPSTTRVLFLSPAVVPRAGWFRRLLDMPIEPDRLFADGEAAALIESAHAARLLEAATRCSTIADVIDVLRATVPTELRRLDEAGRVVLSSADDLPAAETWLLRSLIKPNEGFMSRHFERRISLALTRRLCTTSITPNAITLVSVAIGLSSAPFFLSSSAVVQVAGALLFLTHSILDGCDGELARLQFRESRWGATLDHGGDSLVHTAVFACMAIGWSLRAHSGWPLLLGGAAVCTTLSIAAIVYRRGMRASTGRQASPALPRRVADRLVHRDFIYLILVLSLAGKAHWFVALTAFGAPLFLLFLAWLGRRPAERA
jgi:phosphatidylglycerophosphate synthase